ncbi:MAG TPA: hypothetical protein VFD02_03185 [Syntrophomonadaceae bacterium]|nr:hypothetical protein [Syntrophomonadaceae bacterium]
MKLVRNSTGTARLITATKQKYPLGTSVLDPALEKTAYEPVHKLPNTISGSYRAEIDFNAELVLYHNDGDIPYRLDGEMQILRF